MLSRELVNCEKPGLVIGSSFAAGRMLWRKVVASERF
jgi:hypothetical protein